MSVAHDHENSSRKSPSVKRKLGNVSKSYHLNNLGTRSLFNDIQKPPQLLPPRFESLKPSPLATEKLTRKRRLPADQRKLLPSDQKARLKHERRELQDADIEKWLETTGRFPESQWRIKEKRALKMWFDKLDRDHSGEIDVDELADPLLSTGIAKNMTEVKRLIRSIDEDESNGIGFKEFMNVMKSKNEVVDYKGRKRGGNVKKPQRNKSLEDNSRWKGKTKRRSDGDKLFNVVSIVDYNKRTKTKRKKPLNPIIELTERERNDSTDIRSSLCMERRKLLLDATMGEAERRQRAFAKVQRWRSEMKQLKGVAKLKKLRDISKVVQQMELNQADKENVVQTMKGVLSREMELDQFPIEEPLPIVDKTQAQKDSAKKRNMLLLTEKTKAVGRNGGRHALAFTRTRSPSISTILGIQRQGSISLLKRRPVM